MSLQGGTFGILIRHSLLNDAFIPQELAYGTGQFDSPSRVLLILGGQELYDLALLI